MIKVLFIIVLLFTYSCSHKIVSNQTTGSELIGGEFEMQNHNSEIVTHKTFRGKYQLLFFGFTNCQTVCPIGLSRVGRALRKLSSNHQNQVQPIFVTVDPNRDTNIVIKKYLSSFHSKFVGLRGSQSQLDQMIKRYRGYYGRVEGEAEEYSFDHSDIIYLMGKEGEYITHFSSSTSHQLMAKKIEEVINKNK